MRRVQQTSSDGESNIVTYDGLWRPITTVESGGGTTSYKYNPAGQITELKDPNNNITKWVYDSMGRVATEEQVGNASRQWKYTTPGQTREYTDRTGAKTEYQHNVSGQVSKELWTGTSTAFDYAYDARSRLTGITRSATDKVNWTYNTAGLVTSEVTTIPQVTSALGASSVTSTMNYAYDTAGRTTSKSLSNGSTVQYTDAMLYDFRDRMTQQSRTQSSGGSLWSKFTYNTLDLVTIAQQGTGSVTSNPELVQTTTRDLAGRPTSISYQSGANALATYSMAYVSASNRLASLTTPQGTTNYNYTANGQLIQAGSTGYTYDANGNPTNRAGKTTQIGTWNRLLDDGDFTYQYDAEGRTTGRTSKTTGQTESYVWNRRGQLTQIDVHSNASLTNRTGQVNYSYDPTGRRTSVRNQTGIGSSSYAQSVDYLMSDGDQVGQILGATGQTTRRFRYGIGVDSVLSEQRFSGSTASNPEYQLTDHLGTVRGVAQRTTGVNAAVVNTLQYDSFGKIISQSNASKQPYHGFAGRDIEPVGGLTYNRNRYYSTQTGRFISQDPIGFNAGDENLYRYVGNSPTNARDPSGLWQSGDGKPSQMEVEIEYQLQKVAKSREILVGSVPPNNFVQRMLIGTAYDVAVGVGALSVGSIYNELYDPGNDYETALGLSYVSKTSLVPDGGFTPAEIALNTARRQIAEIAKEADGIGAAVGVTATPLIDELVVEGATTIIPVPVVATIGKRVLTVADDAGKIVLKLSDDLLKSGSHAGLAPIRAPGTLTAAEAAEIQAIAKKYNTTIDVVGSRAAGEGRGLGTNLPVGKGKGTRSDIDLRIDTSHPDAAKIIEECNKVGNGAGNASMKHGTDHRPTYPPFIRITPEG